jgi:hypothetical protein
MADQVDFEVGLLEGFGLPRGPRRRIERTRARSSENANGLTR